MMFDSPRYLLLLVIFTHHFSLFSQTDFLEHYTVDSSVRGAYSVDMVRQFKPYGTAKMITDRFHVFQEILDTSVIHDRALVTFHYDDKTTLINLQNGKSVYSLIHAEYYDSFHFEESNVQHFFRFATINLRYLHNKGNQNGFPFSAGSDTTYEMLDDGKQVCSSIVSINLDTFGDKFAGEIRIYDFFLNDTQFVNIVFQGSRISTDSFANLFSMSSQFVSERENNRNQVVQEPKVSVTIDSSNKVVQLDSTLYQKLLAGNISEKSITVPRSGNYQIYYFYFNGCIPCMLAKPYIRALQKDSRFELVVINGQDKDSSEIRDRLERDSLEGVPIIVADKSLLNDFNVTAFPTLIFFNEYGKEVDRCVGFKEEKYENLLDNKPIRQIKR